jgi:hypothetical protein
MKAKLKVPRSSSIKKDKAAGIDLKNKLKRLLKVASSSIDLNSGLAIYSFVECHTHSINGT